MLTMLIDHVGASWVSPLLRNPSFSLATLQYGFSYEQWQFFNTILRSIGRIAFPIFCFLIVEGYRHTRSWQHYAIRLGVLALLSEIPFDLAFNQQWVNWNHQNVFFTLLLGLLGIALFERSPNPIQGSLIFIILAFVAEYCRVDYGAFGVSLIYSLYLLRFRPFYQAVFGSFLCGFEGWTVLVSFILIYCYNGKRGSQNLSYFYWIYPIHLVIYSWIYHNFIL